MLTNHCDSGSACQGESFGLTAGFFEAESIFSDYLLQFLLLTSAVLSHQVQGRELVGIADRTNGHFLNRSNIKNSLLSDQLHKEGRNLTLGQHFENFGLLPLRGAPYSA